MKQKLLIGLCMLLQVVQATDKDQSGGISFFTVPFETFMQRICPDKKLRSEFVVYYDKLMHSLAELDHQKRTVQLQQLRSQALDVLEVKHPLLAQEIKEKAISVSVNTTDPNDIHCLLTRYGAFEQFNKERIRASNSVWKKVKEYTNEFASRACAWTESLRARFHS
jgi:hypothetical protein